MFVISRHSLGTWYTAGAFYGLIFSVRPLGLREAVRLGRVGKGPGFYWVPVSLAGGGAEVLEGPCHQRGCLIVVS